MLLIWLVHEKSASQQAPPPSSKKSLNVHQTLFAGGGGVWVRDYRKWGKTVGSCVWLMSHQVFISNKCAPPPLITNPQCQLERWGVVGWKANLHVFGGHVQGLCFLRCWGDFGMLNKVVWPHEYLAMKSKHAILTLDISLCQFSSGQAKKLSNSQVNNG